MDFAQVTDTVSALSGRLIRLDFKGLSRLNKINSLFSASKIHWNFTNMDKLAETQTLPCTDVQTSALPYAMRDIPNEYVFEGTTKTVAQYKAERNVSAFLVIKDNKIIQEEYAHGTDEFDLRVSWSMAKSMISILLGALIEKGLIDETAIDEDVDRHVPMLRGTGYEGVSLLNVLQMSSGVAFNEDYVDYHSDINRMGRVLAIGGSMDEFTASLGRRWEPGTYMHYVSVDTHVIGMVIRALTGEEISNLTIKYVLRPLGLERDPVFLTDSYNEPFILGGMNMTTRDYARFALMALNGGKWNDNQIVSKDWLGKTTVPSAPPPSPEKLGIPEGKILYGMQWWMPQNPQDGEFYGVGIYGQYMYVNSAANVVICQNAGDVDFKVGQGIIELETIEMFREIARSL